MTSRFRLRVVTRASKAGPDGRVGGVPRLRVRVAPLDGKANAEVERTLTRLLGSRARVVSGARSKAKLIEVDLGADELGAALTSVFGPE